MSTVSIITICFAGMAFLLAIGALVITVCSNRRYY